MSRLYVNNSCPHSRRAVSMLARASTTLRRSVKVSEISGYQSGPPNVTQVPTLIKQDGTMLVGGQVFDYLKLAKQEPSFPQTPDMSETFAFVGNMNWNHVLAVAGAIVLAYLLFKYYTNKVL